MKLNCRNIIVSAFNLDENIASRYLESIICGLSDHLQPQQLEMESSDRFVESVLRDPANVGICLCGIGMMECSQLNQTRFIHAAVVHNQYIADMCRKHNDANVCIIPTDCIGEKLCGRLVLTYLLSGFDGEAKNKIRVGKIKDMDIIK